MGAIGDLSFGPLELAGWATQILLIAVTALRIRGKISIRRPTISLCILVIVLGWVFRLAYLFALASGGLSYWVGDEALRWLTAWEWLQGWEVGKAIATTWMPGTYYVHGVAMWLAGDPLYGSKLVSAIYSSMSLVGVFVFAQAVFRHRALSIACVLLLTPFWIDILLSVGTMTEMPTTGTMLVGSGALIAGLTSPVGRRRTMFLLCAAVSFAIGTIFHLVAWIHLVGILFFVLPVFLREKHGSLSRRFGSWLVFCVISTSYSLSWMVSTWVKTGNPVSPLLRGAEIGLWKIGGGTRLFELLSGIAPPLGIAIVGLAALSLVVTVALRLARSTERGIAYSGCAPKWLPLVKWFGVGITAILCVSALGEIAFWVSELPRLEVQRLAVNWGVYPVSLTYCLFYSMPLVLYGLVAVVFKRDEQLPHLRLVLGCIGFSLAILVATALNGGANISPFRTVLTLSTALVPFALAPLFDLHPATDTRKPRQGPARLSILIGIVLIGQNFVANHDRIFAELPIPSIFTKERRQGVEPKNADIYALGAWLRSEIGLPGYLSSENLAHPFELVLDREWLGMRQNLIEYSVGDPARFSHPQRVLERAPRYEEESINELVAGQVLITDHAVDDPRLRLIVRISEFSIYEFVKP